MDAFKIDRLPLTAFDARADLRRRLSQLCLAIGVNAFLHAGRALCPVKDFKAAMQAVVAHRTIAVAVAGLLVQHRRNLCGHLVRSHLVRMREIWPGKLRATEDGRQRMRGR